MSRSWKMLAVAAATAVAALALSTTSALAGSTGSGSPWRITLGAASRTAPYPGAGAERLAFTVANSGRSTEALRTVTASILTGRNGDAETAAGADIPGCRAGWFTASVDRGLPVTVGPGESYAGTVELSMQDSGTNQDACRGAAPAITLVAG